MLVLSENTLHEIKKAADPILRDGGARKAMVIGSVARGDADEYSDLDVIIIADTDKPFVERYEDFFGILRIWRRGVDLFVYTPEEFESMRERDNPFLRKAMEDAVTIYEKQ